MARGKTSNPVIIIIVIILILFIIPTCICGGFLVVGLGTAVEMENMEQDVRDEVQRLTEELHEREAAVELVPDPEAEVEDNTGESVEVPAVEDESPQPEK